MVAMSFAMSLQVCLRVDGDMVIRGWKHSIFVLVIREWIYIVESLSDWVPDDTNCEDMEEEREKSQDMASRYRVAT